ncbi:g-type lectin s-receptor-like serine/threonine-protein kinase rlk1 [Quercus suber]|uniref:G-type lectin s-receptor-like serine/threonine-protein kinase rlk1 n=1 Tax=Quercus suber TaxID=58331 RepID=A0AAW0L2W2_QUESU
MSSGCERNFTAENCKASMTYTMEAVNNTIWEDKKYFCSLLINPRGLQSSMFAGLLLESDPNIAFIKVSISTPTTARNVPKKSKKEVLIISVSLVAFAFIVLVIFGIATLQGMDIVSGHGADYNVLEEEAILEEWAYHCFECGELGKLVGDKKVDKKQLERITKVALWCILYEPSLRPSIKKVLQMLEGTVDILDPPSRSVASSVWSKE